MANSTYQNLFGEVLAINCRRVFDQNALGILDI
jgi:hypothetical protein